MGAAVDVALVVLGLPVLLSSLYLFALTLLSARPSSPAAATPTTRFRVVIPAHDEAEGIRETVRSVLAVDYPRELFDVLVVADNCTDATAEIARDAGAEVVERRSETERGKGYALQFGFECLPTEVAAAVVVDADTIVSPNLLRAFDARLRGGAVAVQADYAVRNPSTGWRTLLVAIGFGAFHIVRSRARERLGLSTGLRGNGMCFSANVLRDVPHEAYSIVEDVEYGLRLADRGIRVAYADEAHVYGEMAHNPAAARHQRARWEGGRAALTRRWAPAFLARGVRGDRMLLDLAFDLLLPPLSRVATLAAAGLVLSWAGTLLVGGLVASRVLFSFSVGAVILYVLRGWMVSATGWRGLGALVLAPIYVVWKATIPREAAPGGGAVWVRTERQRNKTSVE